MQVFQGYHIFYPQDLHRIRHKNDSIGPSQNQLAGGIVFNLSGDSIEVYLDVVTEDGPHGNGQKIKKEGPVALGL